MQLEQLGYFYFSDNLGLCAPGTTSFVDWLKGIEQHDGPYCNQSDVAVIESLYQATGGANWTNSDGWLGEAAVSEWYGVRADDLGRVTGLDLSDNGLEGRVPGNLGQLSQMTELRIGGNALSGRLPLELDPSPSAGVPLRGHRVVRSGGGVVPGLAERHSVARRNQHGLCAAHGP